MTRAEKIAAAMPAAVAAALRQVLPGRYTPELAEKIAADVIARLADDHQEVGR